MTTNRVIEELGNWVIAHWVIAQLPDYPIIQLPNHQPGCMNSCLVEFEDGYRVVTSRYYVPRVRGPFPNLATLYNAEAEFQRNYQPPAALP